MTWVCFHQPRKQQVKLFRANYSAHHGKVLQLGPHRYWICKLTPWGWWTLVIEAKRSLALKTQTWNLVSRKNWDLKARRHFPLSNLTSLMKTSHFWIGWCLPSNTFSDTKLLCKQWHQRVLGTNPSNLSSPGQRKYRYTVPHGQSISN